MSISWCVCLQTIFSQTQQIVSFFSLIFEFSFKLFNDLMHVFNLILTSFFILLTCDATASCWLIATIFAIFYWSFVRLDIVLLRNDWWLEIGRRWKIVDPCRISLSFLHQSAPGLRRVHVLILKILDNFGVIYIPIWSRLACLMHLSI